MADNAINEINAGLDGIGQRLDSLVEESKSSKTSQKALEAKLKELGEKQLSFAKELMAVKQSNDEVEGKSEVKSIGTQFIETKSFADFKNNKRASAIVERKAATTSANVTNAYNAPGIAALPEQQLVIESLIPHVPVNTTSVSYVKEKSNTIGAKVVAEGTAKPETTFEFEQATAEIVTVAHWTRITKQLANYAPAVEAFINAKMQYGLQLAVEKQLINGDGTSGNLSGLLKTGNYTDYSTSITSESSDTLLDFAMRIQTAMEDANYIPQCLILRPSDWSKLALIKDKQNRYILGGPNALAQKMLWGTRVETCASMTAGKFLMPNFELGATIYDGQSLRLDMSESDGDNFTKNLITIRVERDLGLAVERPAAIAGGSFAIPTTAAASGAASES